MYKIKVVPHEGKVPANQIHWLRESEPLIGSAEYIVVDLEKPHYGSPQPILPNDCEEITTDSILEEEIIMELKKIDINRHNNGLDDIFCACYFSGEIEIEGKFYGAVYAVHPLDLEDNYNVYFCDLSRVLYYRRGK